MGELRMAIAGLHNHYHAYPMADYLVRGEVAGARLVAVADERERYARQFGEQYCGGDWTTDYESLLARDDIDAVIVTSYTSAHADHVELAARHGKHVLLDKPISTTLEDARRIVEASGDVKIMMAYLLRFLPVYEHAYEIVRSGAIGELVSAFYSIRIPASFIKDAPDADDQGWYRDPVKAGGGGFLDHGVHFTDFIRWFFGSEAESVTARTASLTYKDLGVEDYGIATYQLESGAIATVESTWHAAEFYSPVTSPDRCTLTGTRGEIELHYQTTPQMSVASLDAPYQGRTHFDLVGDDRYEACYRRNLEAFVRCIREDTEPTPTAYDGLKALEMILSAYEADRSGRAVDVSGSGAPGVAA
jgi:predicted dehydrogenase